MCPRLALHLAPLPPNTQHPTHLSISSWLILMLSNMNMNPQKHLASLRPTYVGSILPNFHPCGCCVRSASSSRLPTQGYYLHHQSLFTDMPSFHFFISNSHRQAVGDGAPLDASNTPSVLAVCNVHGGNASTLYYSTAFSGGPAVRTHPEAHRLEGR